MTLLGHFSPFLFDFGLNKSIFEFVNNEELSIAFLQEQIETDFKYIFEHYLITDVEWLEGSEIRPVGYLTDPQDTNKKIDIIVLFPPFEPTKYKAPIN